MCLLIFSRVVEGRAALYGSVALVECDLCVLVPRGVCVYICEFARRADSTRDGCVLSRLFCAPVVVFCKLAEWFCELAE
jgi:hypothetical protein